MSLLLATWQILLELAPWLLLGTLVAAVLHVVLPAGWIRRRLRGPRGVVEAVALGVPLPLCSCGVVPAGLGLKKDGASDGASVGFLVSTPQTGVDSILVAASFLGWPFALMKVLAAGVTGIVAGLLADAVGRGTRSDEAAVQPDSPSVESPRRGFRAAVEHGLEILRSIWLWVLVGVVASAVITVAVPNESLAFAGRWGALAAGGIALSLSLPLYVCATASVPIAAALVARGLPAGAALVFLMAGPATNIGTIGAIHKRLGGRITAVYVGTIVVGSLAFAWLFEWLVPGAEAIALGGEHVHGTWWAWPPAIVLAGLFVWFAVDDLWGWIRRCRVGFDESDAGLRVPVEGMSCGGCTSKLEAALRNTAGVDAVTVRLEPGEAVVRGEVSESTVREVIAATGFRVPVAP